MNKFDAWADRIEKCDTMSHRIQWSLVMIILPTAFLIALTLSIVLSIPGILEWILIGKNHPAQYAYNLLYLQ